MSEIIVPNVALRSPFAMRLDFQSVPLTLAPQPGKAGKRFAFLDSVHPEYDERWPEWLLSYKRLVGGRHALDELVPFEWEVPDGEHHRMRKAQAIYPNFSDQYANVLAGHLTRNAPVVEDSLSFGTLGAVRRQKDIDEPSPAELLYYNTDGQGVNGSQWDPFWLHVIKGAVALGHWWVLVEGPPRVPSSFQDEIDGLRPWLSTYSPLSVRNWEWQNGRLMMLLVHRRVFRIVLGAEGRIERQYTTEKLLLTADGFLGFGRQFSNGGWYRFDEDHNLVQFGFFELTEGQIPAAPLYYERLRQSPISFACSKSGTVELGNLSVAHMNQTSAMLFDAWDAASSTAAVLGADADGYNLFIQKMKAGNRFAPVPLMKDLEHPPVPQIADTSMGGVVSNVFDTTIRKIEDTAERLMMEQLNSAPYASGESKKVTWREGKSPRLTIMAGEVETAQNTIIHFAEQMWGTARAGRPAGAVEWPRSFDIAQPADEIMKYFQVVEMSQLRSPTAEARAMLALLRRLALMPDDETKAKIERELGVSAEAVAKRLREPAAPQPAARPPAPQPAAV